MLGIKKCVWGYSSKDKTREKGALLKRKFTCLRGVHLGKGVEARKGTGEGPKCWRKRL